MIVTLVLWFFFSIVIFMFGSELNTMSFLGYPLAYYMTAQGSLLAFVIIFFGVPVNKKILTKNSDTQKERMTNV